MLPDTIYRSLPYIYIVVGVFCATLVESSLVYFAAGLLVVAGLIVLWMRHAGGAKYDPIKSITPHSSGSGVSRETHEDRRQARISRQFPIINHSGEIIAFDRRIGST